MIYAAAQWSIEKTNPGKTKNLLQFFSNSISDNEALKNSDYKEGYCYYRVSDGTHKFEYSLSHNGLFDFGEWSGLNIHSVFIPTTEMLSHSKGFLALYEKYNMPFDGTQVDIIVNASLPETRKIPKSMNGVLKKISNHICRTGFSVCSSNQNDRPLKMKLRKNIRIQFQANRTWHRTSPSDDLQ